MANSEHKPKECYGAWAGNPKGSPYDPKRCIEEVWVGPRGMILSQCSKKAGHGPKGLYCATHNPEAVARRNAKQTAKYEAERERRNRPHNERVALLKVVRSIAKGHNDPRTLCLDTLKQLKLEA